MGKGSETRQLILERAAQTASRSGLDGLTIGQLAGELGLSKSGLFAHFHSKEALQVQTLRHAAELFVDRVVRPALKAPRGEPRLRALFERWLAWAQADVLKGGCLFVAAATELDDLDGPARDELVRQQRDWLELIANVARTGVGEGHFQAGLDTEQLAHDLHGVMLAYHHARRLLRDPRAPQRARSAFDALVRAARAPRPARSARARAS
ncbi:MAG TPA: TetR/AcrR family transcriptional regulator [Vicinamibacteria bacterium]|jgi:AcrR family transcriptional regulator